MNQTKLNNNFSKDKDFLMSLSKDNDADILQKKTQLIFLQKFFYLSSNLLKTNDWKENKFIKYVKIIGNFEKIDNITFYDDAQTDLFLDVQKQNSDIYTVHLGVQVGLKRTNQKLLDYYSLLMEKIKSDSCTKINTVSGIRLDPTQQAQIIEYEESETDEEF